MWLGINIRNRAREIYYWHSHLRQTRKHLTAFSTAEMVKWKQKVTDWVEAWQGPRTLDPERWSVRAVEYNWRSLEAVLQFPHCPVNVTSITPCRQGGSGMELLQETARFTAPFQG